MDREADGDGEAEVRETESEEAILNKKIIIIMENDSKLVAKSMARK